MTWISPARAAAHLIELRAAGMGTRAIAEAARLGRSTIQNVPKFVRIHAATEAAILAVRPAPVVPRNQVCAVGSQRRIGAMLAIGWSMAEQSALTGGVHPAPWQRILQQTHVRPATVDLVKVVYDKLSMSVPPARTAAWVRALARRRGFFPPLAWDDDVIDDPEALPCILPLGESVDRDVELDVQHLAAGHVIDVTNEVRVEFVRRTRNWRAVTVAEHALCDVRTIFKIRKALDR